MLGLLFGTTVAGKTMGTNLRNRNNGMHVKRFSDGSSVDDPMPAVSGGAGIDGQQSERQGATVEQAPYLPYAFYLSDYSHLEGLKSFVMGRFVVQDVSSMLVTEAADPKPGDYVIDLCAAPGGKSLHMADKMQGQGMVDARDLTDYKVGLIEENIERTQTLNIRAHRKDATLLDKESVEKADIVLADVPCSGLGVIGKKTDIKYRTDEDKFRSCQCFRNRSFTMQLLM